MLHTLLLTLLLVVGIGQGGIQALSDITGLRVKGGCYDFYPGYTMITASGQDEQGGRYDITIKWVDGLPAWILLTRGEEGI